MPIREQVPHKNTTDFFTEVEHDTHRKETYHEDFLRSFSQTLINLLKKWWLALIFLVIIYLILRASIFITESSYVYVYENQLTGKINVYDSPGIHFKTPFSPVTRYKQVWTVNFGNRFTGKQILEKGPIQLRFADSYTANLPAIFRYKLPRNQNYIIMIHREFSRFYNLIDSLLIPISRSVTVMTATQYTGEEFFLGGLNSFRRQLLDQLQYGIYETERRQFDVEQKDLIALGSQQESTPPKITRFKLWKTVPIKGEDGEIKRMDNLLETYGIEVIQVDLGVPVPELELERRLADRKRFYEWEE
jgi:regulator of protease activity HflC (stomatin/prohibitin superfamily)